MKALLFAMPDTVSALDPVILMPNLGLCSIAGNLEECDVKVVDLAFHNRNLTRSVKGLMAEYQPDVVGLSAMSFQYASARRVSQICRSLKPGIIVVLGGYHASMMYEEVGASADAGMFDFLVRGEGEITFNRLIQEIGSGRRRFAGIPGLSYRDKSGFQHNVAAGPLDLDKLRPPDRDCRLWDGARFFDKRFDCIETSRGCTMSCRFCSITRMHGRSIRVFSLERVIAELKPLKARGIEGIFFVDDNITLDVPRLKELCRLIIEENLNTMTFAIQASVRGVASDPELAGLLSRAGFSWVFLGIENGIARNLASMSKSGVLENTRSAVSLLQEQAIGVFGGLITGNPQDNADDIKATYRFALEIGVDHPIMQCLTPYPKTATRDDLAKLDLITNPDDYSRYNGFMCNVRTEHLSNRQLLNAMFRGGLSLYFHPGYLRRSRFWRYSPAKWPALAANNFRYLAGAVTGRIFASRHTW
jgi:anaerobic magnesium-protoporphyrin IX monomethyl ester cyclase